MDNTTTVDTLTAALGAAARGWHVFPLRPGSKRPAGHAEDGCPGTGRCAGGHRTWEQRATTDPDKIRAAWTQAPYGIGIATGPSGLCVLDLDTLKPGEAVPERWAAVGARGAERTCSPSWPPKPGRSCPGTRSPSGRPRVACTCTTGCRGT